MRNSKRSILIFASGVLLSLLLAPPAPAQQPPQYNWVLEKEFGQDACTNQFYALSVDSSGRIYATQVQGSVILVFDSDGSFLRTIGTTGEGGGSQLYFTYGLTVDQNDLIYVGDGRHGSGPVRVKVFDTDGNFVRAFGSDGSAPGQLYSALSIAVNQDGLVYIADAELDKVEVFGPDGTYLRRLALPENCTYVRWVAADGTGVVYCKWGWYSGATAHFQTWLFDSDGAFLRSWGQPGDCIAFGPDGLVYSPTRDDFRVLDREGNLILGQAGALSYCRAVATAPDGRAYVVYGDLDTDTYKIQVLRRIDSRTHGPAVPNAAPFPEVTGVAQRDGTTILDIDYKVTDADDAAVTAYAVALVAGAQNLGSLIPIATLTDDTEANIGPNVAANTPHRVSWNVGADWDADYGNLKITILAKDGRDLIGLHFLHMPAVDQNYPALTINRIPLQESDFLPVWFWLIASGDATVRLDAGKVYGVGGNYDGVVLAEDTTTTDEGRAFIFARLGVREATADELRRAREIGTPGSVTTWAPRLKYFPSMTPATVNEFNFDTASTTGWWVVKD